MASSTFTQYTSEHFVESCGAVLFDLTIPTKEVCLVKSLKNNGEWYLAKGRRNQEESRQSAALRETMEETGYRCYLQPVAMPTRAPPQDAGANVPDQAHVFAGLKEPFMITVREIGDTRVKFIYWYIAALEKGARSNRLPGEVAFEPEFFPCEEALEKLTFETDRKVLKRAIELVESTQITKAPLHSGSLHSYV